MKVGSGKTRRMQPSDNGQHGQRQPLSVLPFGQARQPAVPAHLVLRINIKNIHSFALHNLSVHAVASPRSVLQQQPVLSRFPAAVPGCPTHQISIFIMLWPQHVQHLCPSHQHEQQ